jgi:hypothetical protein
VIRIGNDDGQIVFPDRHPEKVGDRVVSPKGPGVVANGYRTAKLVQYRLKRDDAGFYWALEET